jgi:hypothetical protein
MIMKVKGRALIAAALGAALLLAGGCAPDSGFNNVSDYDVVVTRYDSDTDYQKYTTFVVADTVLHLGQPDGDGEDLPDGLEELIISEVEEQMIRYGYTLEANPESNDPDLVMIAGVTTTTWTGYVPGYPWYPGYGWGPWYPWYPWYSYGYVYQYDTGTIIVIMSDYSTLDPDTDDIEVIWTGGMNGILSSSSSYNADRITAGIRQAFDQSPYLKKSTTP